MIIIADGGTNKKKEIKIEVEEDKKYSNNIAQTQPNQINNIREKLNIVGGYIQCDYCNKKFTKINYESHLPECKQKYKGKKNTTFVSKPNLGMLASSSPTKRQPTMPAVTYGGHSNKPGFSIRFKGK